MNLVLGPEIWLLCHLIRARLTKSNIENDNMVISQYLGRKSLQLSKLKKTECFIFLKLGLGPELLLLCHVIGAT